MTAAVELGKYRACLETLQPVQVHGKVTQVVGLVVEAAGPACRLGAVCDIFTREGGRPLAAEALGFRERRFARRLLWNSTSPAPPNPSKNARFGKAPRLG